MKMNTKMIVVGLVLGLMFCYTGTALAETAVSDTSAAVDLNFQINIANYIEFRVGTAGAVTDTIVFNPSVGDLSASNTITGTGGDVGGSQVNVSLISNTPSITITATNNTPNGLVNGADFINWESISTTDLGAALTPPLLTNAGGTTSPTALFGAQTITTIWEYQYTRRAGVDPIPTQNGAYTGTVTYTASTP